MSRPRQLELDAVAWETLEQMRDHHPRAYMRERAAALLKVAAGEGIGPVAGSGLLRRRNWKTVAEWVNRYAQDGLAGLYIRRGRGRKPAFPP